MEMKINFYLFENIKYQLKRITNKRGFNGFDDICVKIELKIPVRLKSCYSITKGFGGPRLIFYGKMRENIFTFLWKLKIKVDLTVLILLSLYQIIFGMEPLFFEVVKNNNEERKRNLENEAGEIKNKPITTDMRFF